VILNRSKPLTYLITDRLSLDADRPVSTLGTLVDFIRRALDAGVDMIQIRERDLQARDVLSIADAAMSFASSGARILVNDRADVAACAGAGTHLPTRSMPVEVVRTTFGQDMLIGSSTHSLSEAIEAERGGADFVVFGPVFPTSSKKIPLRPVGLDALRDVSRTLRIPVLALGGISVNNAAQALEAGAAGIAGISIFARSADLPELVRAIRGT
jgi:thiamine-phosphate diphosphorylase